ncbi:MAG: glycosyltransferase family 39 protein [Parcubacteria group bacterium]|nr:glycosyltransferase family 39 protein [Parcubacteria group bacterium]
MLKKDIIALVSIFILVSLAGGIWLKFVPDFGVTQDALSYDNTAVNLSQGNGFTEYGSSADGAPVYPFFLSGIYVVFGHNYTYVKIIQILILGLISLFVYFIAKNFLNLSFVLALSASIIVVLWPYFLLYSNLLLTEIVFSFMLILLVYLVLRFQKNPQYLNAAAIGGTLGIATLTRPSALFLPIWLCGGFVILFKKFRKKTQLLKLSFLILIFLATLIPWTIRNYVELNKLLPIRSGFHNVTQKAFVEIDYFSIETEKLKPGEATLGKIIVSRLQNIYLFWKPGAGGTQAKRLTQKYPSALYLILIYKIVFLLMLALSFLSLKFIKKKKILLLWLFIAYFWALHSVLFPYPRYTLPIIPLVILLCFFMLQTIKRKVKQDYSAPNT